MAAQNVVFGLQLTADGSGFVGAINVSRDALKQLGNDAQTAGNKTNTSFTTAARGVRSISDQLVQARNVLLSYIGVVQGVNLARRWLETADAIGKANAQIQLFTESSVEAAAAKERLYQMAQHFGMEVRALTESFVRLQPAVTAMGGNAQTTLDLVEAMSAAAQTSYASTEASTAAMTKFTQAMESGTMSGKELKAMLNAMPTLARALADGLGVSVQELRKMADEGEISADRMAKALLSQSEKLQIEAAAMGDSWGEGWTRVENAMLRAVEATNKQYRITDLLSTTANLVAEEIGKMNEATDGTAVSMKEAWEAGRDLAVGLATIYETGKFLIDVVKAIGGSFQVVASDAKWFFSTIKLGVAGLSGNVMAMIKAKNDLDAVYATRNKTLADANAQYEKLATHDYTQLSTGLRQAVYNETVKTNAPADVNLSVDPAIIEKQWRAVTGSVKTADSVEREYQKTLTASRDKYGQLIGAMKARGATDDEIAAKARVQADIEAGLTKKRDQDIESLRRQGKTKIEVHDQYAKALLTTTERLAAAERTLEAAAAQAQLAELDRLYSNQLISEEGYQQQKLAIKRAGYDKQLAMLQEAMEEEKTLILQLEAAAEKEKDPGKRDKLLAEAEKHRQKLIDLTVQYGKVLNDIDAAEGEYQAAAIKGLQEREKFQKKLTEETEKFVDQLNSANEERKFELSIMGKTQKQQAVLIEQRKVDLAVREKLAAIEKEIERQQKSGNLQAVEALRAQHQQIREEAERTKAAIAETLPLYQQATEQARQQQEFMSNLEKSMTDMLVKWIDDGKSGWDSFLDYLKTTAKATLIKIPVQWVMNAVGGMFGGGGGGSGMFSGFMSMFGGMFGSKPGGVATQPNDGIYGPTPDGGNIATPPVSGLGSMGGFGSYLGYAAMIYAMMQQNDSLYKQGWQPSGQYNDIQKELLKHGAISGLLGSGGVLGGVFLNGAIQMGLDKLLQNLGLSGRTASIITGSALWTRAFGYKKPEMTSGGVQGTLSLGGFDGEMFQDWTARGGWFRRDRRGTETEPMNRAMRQLINNTVGKVPQQMADLLEEFDQDFDTVFGEDWSKWFKITLADKGNWEDVQARLANETARVYRDMATVAVESIREGWGKYVSDLKDLEAEGFYEEMGRIILSLNVLDNIKDVQGKLFGVSGLLIEDFEALADAGELIYETISRLAETFSVTNDLTKLTGIKFVGDGLASTDARQALVDEAGGAAALSELTGNYWSAFATETEQFSRLGESLVDTFGQMKLAVPSTVEAYKQMVAAQDMSTEEGRKNAMALMGVVQLWQQTVGVLETMRVNMGNTIADLRRAVEFGGLDEQAKYNKLKKEADDAYADFQTATDPAEIQKLFERITSNMSETWNMLSDDQKAASRAEYLAKLDELEAEKDRRIDAAKEAYTGVDAAQDNIAESGNKLAQAILDVAGQLGADISDVTLRDVAPQALTNAGLDEPAVQQLADSLMGAFEALPSLMKPLLLDLNTADSREDVLALTREMLAKIKEENNINGSGEAQIQSAIAMADAARNAGASLEDSGARAGNTLERAIAGAETRLAAAVPKEIVVRVEQVRYASNEV
ncbi:MAG: tape measure protein [Burkholderiales bacterium]|jgi:tape measure domain-containing protein|nr:tape measure protein [Burkholderiales bacterium]